MNITPTAQSPTCVRLSKPKIIHDSRSLHPHHGRRDRQDSTNSLLITRMALIGNGFLMFIGCVVVSLQGGDHCFDHRFVVFPQRLLAPTDLTDEVSDAAQRGDLR